ncbi:iron-sulfur protein NUBPL isoform X1 [Selaginella moellendorffii]|nr:iron-sulfur protein NUBPL isoform X1 [Selaginella moellendorffii]|eukprot:XP_002966077.2 iron-sulfur protein NUBPL isoform X1 [Selaginella moellendorffii]
MARRALAMAAGALSKPQLDGVERIIAVASGKGGVGKSTTAVNLAVALALKCKLRVGLLDADVYGPSIPLLMNLSGQPKIDSANKMVPLENYGVKCMSMGFLMDKDAPVVWRGPMVMSALEKLTRGVSWGKLDIMVVDMPPGTGDAQISVSQRLKLAGAVIVSTPQDIALLDARRGTNMFQKVHVPILGLIENMSYFICPGCGQSSHIFGHGGCETTAKEMQIDFLGKVPLDVHIRETSDEGKPIVASSANSDVAAVYNSIATRIVDKMRELASAGAYVTPNISVG